MTVAPRTPHTRDSERGAMLVSAYAAAFPILLLWILIPIQVAFWYNAREAAQLAAEEAAILVAVEDADPTKATTVANNLVQGDPSIINPQVAIVGIGTDEVTVTVTAELSWRILPLPKDVTARARVQTEQFIPEVSR